MSAVSFANDILPLFSKTTDIPHMADFGVMLAEYSYMSVPANARRCWIAWMEPRSRSCRQSRRRPGPLRISSFSGTGSRVDISHRSFGFDARV